MNKTYRKISIILELERSIKYLRLGLSEVQRISADNDFYDPVFIYLSGGLERLFKTMLCLNFQELKNRLPNKNEIWNNRNGHNLNLLKSKVEKICIPISRSFASSDYDIITKEKFIDEICTILSAFGNRARYFNIDAILGQDQDFDAKENWGKMEILVGEENYGKEKFYELLAEPTQLDKIYSETNKEIIIRLEIFFRALTRQFIFGDFSKKASAYLFQIETFTDIKDSQLGKTNYNQFEIYERIKRKN